MTDKRPTIWYTGAPRTATAAMAQFGIAMGVEARHQARPMWRDLPFSQWRLWPYNGVGTPESVSKFVSNRHKATRGLQLDSSHELALYFGHALAQTDTPDLVIIGIRNPTDQCNSHRALLAKTDKTWLGRMDVDYFALYYRRLYRWIAEQARQPEIASRVRWVSFGKLVSGTYNGTLLKLLRIEPTEENRQRASAVWQKRHNHRGSYAIEKSDIYPSCYNALSMCRDTIEELETC